MKDKIYDLIIIGAGPAALTAAVYAARYKLNVLVLGRVPGGLINEAHKVCNFPTYEGIKGFELGQKMVAQVKAMGVLINNEEVIEIKKNENFKIKTKANEHFSKKIILAIGTKRRMLDVKGERDFFGRGVSYCATCDGAFYKDKKVGVVGGGNSALTAALLLSEYATEVYLIYRKDKFTKAEPAWIEQVEKNKKIKPVFNSNVVEIFGSKGVEGVKLDNNEEIKLDGVFIEIGSVPDEKLLKPLGLELDGGYVVVNKNHETNVKGVFVAGDITNNPLKQVVTACAEGAIAAKTAYEEIRKNL
ncbi:MAG: FAD-dependent oxidoreductase [Candidatus Pacearchaeota archaeon]|jgi:thioredoxin reductase (NADPH)